jgi:undecaprenyl-diphosphatase
MDQSLFSLINNWAGRWAFTDSLGIFLAEYLGYILIVLVPVIFWRQFKEVIVAGFAAILARFALVELIRLAWQRPRPFVADSVNLLIEKADTPSFPSGHASLFFAVATVVFCYNKKAGILFFIASALISVSRVFIGVHWPSDVVAGAFVGLFAGWLAVKIAKRF